jgi:hypothetical protein
VHVAPGTYEVLLLDVNPIADTLQPLLFDWAQLPYGGGRGPGISDSEAESEGEGDGEGEGGGEGDADAGDGGGGGGGPPGSRPRAEAHGADSSSYEDSDDDGGDDDDWERVPLLLVDAASAVQPGALAACGMPFDMLGLQEGMDDLLRAVQRQQRGEGGGSDGEDD